MGKILRLSVTILSLIIITSCIAGTGALPDSLYTSSIYPGTSNESDLGENTNYWNDVCAWNVHAYNIYTTYINGSDNWTGPPGAAGAPGAPGADGDIFFEGARVRKTTNTSVANNTWVNICYNTEDYDTDNIHDNVTNNDRLTCNTAGYYLVYCNIYWSQNGTGERDIILNYNDGTVPNIARDVVYPNTSAYLTIQSVSTVWYMDVGSYFCSWVRQTSGVTLNVLTKDNYSPVFGMQRIGENPPGDKSMGKEPDGKIVDIVPKDDAKTDNVTKPE